MRKVMFNFGHNPTNGINLTVTRELMNEFPFTEGDKISLDYELVRRLVTIRLDDKRGRPIGKTQDGYLLSTLGRCMGMEDHRRRATVGQWDSSKGELSFTLPDPEKLLPCRQMKSRRSVTKTGLREAVAVVNAAIENDPDVRVSVRENGQIQLVRLVTTEELIV